MPNIHTIHDKPKLDETKPDPTMIPITWEIIKLYIDVEILKIQKEILKANIKDLKGE